MNIEAGEYGAYKSWFRLDSENSSYVMAVCGQGYLHHIYYGDRLEKNDMPSLLENSALGWYPPREGETLLDKLSLEYPGGGMADLRPPALNVLWESMDNIADLRYESHIIYSGKKAVEGLPATYAENDGEAASLEIVLEDGVKGLRCTLYYTIFKDSDALARRSLIENTGGESVLIGRASSASLALPAGGWELLHLHGAWIKEFTPERMPVGHMSQRIYSNKGASGHQHNPFMAVLEPGCNEEQGKAYALSLVYSGDFHLECDRSALGSLRVNIGLGSDNFSWSLAPGEKFLTPEAVLVYSGQGLGHMSRSYHSLYGSRLCRGKWRDRARPVLLNTWEGLYFDFDREKLVAAAKHAAEMGIELFVLDDGWFGKRNDDKSSLGDWAVNEEKLGCSLKELVSEINSLGLMFGIWVEPEMISPESELYKKHPDWVLMQPGRQASLARTQLVLDLSRSEVQSYIIDEMSRLFSSANIAYVKWDMNRNFTEVGSFGGGRPGELPHRYMLGLYRVLETLTQRFPHILFESCASGGGRFDAGMLHYMPQGWLSDNSDAACRVLMEYGASMVYPLSAMGCHVSGVPNHQVGRVTPANTRFNIAAMGGGFGYELDARRLGQKEKEEAAQGIAQYKKHRDSLHGAALHRIGNPARDNICAFLQVSRNEDTAVLTVFKKINSNQADETVFIPLPGLDLNGVYECRGGAGAKEMTGRALAAVGACVKLKACDFSSARVILRKIR